jgi:GH43 family beta-xylosidase
MNSATTVGTSTKISTPTYSWEKVGAAVNEGAAMLYHGGRTFLVFSASNCAGTGYKLGRLELAAGGNPLSAGSWSKYGSPIFESGYGNYQPGHNGFFNGPSASGIWMVYHANSVTPGTFCLCSQFSLLLLSFCIFIFVSFLLSLIVSEYLSLSLRALTHSTLLLTISRPIGTCDGARYTMVQAVNWNSDGTPNLGSPRALDNNVPEPA